MYLELSSLPHGILLNAREPGPLRDRRVRQALDMAVDRQAIIKNLYAGRGHLLKRSTGKRRQHGRPGRTLIDPARAKELLADAGYRTGSSHVWQMIGR